MSLIWRSIFEVTPKEPGGPSLIDSAESMFVEWCRFKCQVAGVAPPELSSGADNGSVSSGPLEFTLRAGSGEGGRVFRGTCFETRERDAFKVRLTFTAIEGAEHSWAWVDLDRWLDDPYSTSFVPSRPRLLGEIVSAGHWKCKLGDTRFLVTPSNLSGREQADQLLVHVLSESRTVPVVVVTSASAEGDDLSAAQRRAASILERVLGIAIVVVVDRLAASTFNDGLQAKLGNGFGVFPGAIRTYLPGVSVGDSPRRHRYFPISAVTNQSTDGGSLLVAPEIVRRSSEQEPPQAWIDFAKALVKGSEPSDKELVKEWDRLEKDRDEAVIQLSQAGEEIEELVLQNDYSQTEIIDLVASNAKLTEQLHELGGTVDATRILGNQRDAPAPESCSEVLDRLYLLTSVEFPDSLWRPTMDLDEFPQAGLWAKCAWGALLAMEDYATARNNGWSGGGFWEYCEKHQTGLTVGKIAMKESETTNNSTKLKGFRTFQVRGFGTKEPKYMEAHIKIGGNAPPAPRLHFFDDATGSTKKIHVGYLGRHLPLS